MRPLPFALLSTFCWAPSVWACAVCGQSTDENQWAYIAMTAMLSLLPLLMLGFGLAWVVRRTHRAEQRAAAAAKHPESTG